jgi:hypothetical protein
VAKDRASKIQLLSVKHPGLMMAVDTMFEEFGTLQGVSDMIERVYHEKASRSAVSTYKQKHWKVWKDKIQETVTSMRAISRLVGEDGLTAGVRALLWQALQTMTPPQLISLKRALNDDKKVDLMKKHFALYAEEHRQKMEQRSAIMKASQADTDVVDDYEAAQQVVEQVKEIFGIGTRQLAPPAPKLLAPPQEMPSPAPVVAVGNERA